jgi:hypothetical protein
MPDDAVTARDAKDDVAPVEPVRLEELINFRPHFLPVALAVIHDPLEMGEDPGGKIALQAGNQQVFLPDFNSHAAPEINHMHLSYKFGTFSFQ